MDRNPDTVKALRACGFTAAMPQEDHQEFTAIPHDCAGCGRSGCRMHSPASGGDDWRGGYQVTAPVKDETPIKEAA